MKRRHQPLAQRRRVRAQRFEPMARILAPQPRAQGSPAAAAAQRRWRATRVAGAVPGRPAAARAARASRRDARSAAAAPARRRPSACARKARPMAPANRCSSCASISSQRRLSGTAASAAAEGVGARTSATKSAMVTSTSWPTPDTVGHAAGGDRARHALVVEAPEILERAAAARDDQHVAFVAARRGLDGAHDFRDRGRALHGGGIEQHARRRESARAALSICRGSRRPWAR